MKDLEERIAAAEHLLAYRETYRFLEGHAVVRVSQSMLNLLSCIACKAAHSEVATVNSVANAGCATTKDGYNIGARLVERGVVIRSAAPKTGLSGKPAFALNLQEAPDKVTSELLANAPCAKQEA